MHEVAAPALRVLPPPLSTRLTLPASGASDLTLLLPFVAGVAAVGGRDAGNLLGCIGYRLRYGWNSNCVLIPMKLTRGWFLALSVMWLAIFALMMWLDRIWDACGALLAATAFFLVALRRKQHLAGGSQE
ncbi:hypothetical protein [Stenotrophomonas sp. 3diitr2024]|uniref:hypothetical protein n=1 Tax=Stenotrophomonas sp. 3diitr2024 TaxID=3345115 RepID=UPI0035C94C7F